MTDELNRTLKLTATQREILNHRLTVPDAMAEVLAEDHAAEDVELVADLLLAGRLSDAMAHSGAVTHDVLVDAVEGSTVTGCDISEHGRSSLRIQATINAGNALARKIGKFVGREVAFPDF
jgi:hypothetical protein